MTVYHVEQAQEYTDWPAVTEVFNHYIRTSMAAYPMTPVAAEVFSKRWSDAPDWPFLIASLDGEVVGFAHLDRFHPASTMRQSMSLTYFILPDHTGRGLGRQLLDVLIFQGAAQGARNFFANISSENLGSIRFHLKNGFEECGRMHGVGIKQGREFDMVWFQKRLTYDA